MLQVSQTMVDDGHRELVDDPFLQELVNYDGGTIQFSSLASHIAHGFHLPERTAISGSMLAAQAPLHESVPSTCEIESEEARVQVPNKKGKGSRGKGSYRGPLKGLKVKEVMHLEFDDLGRPCGKWRLKYGQQAGICARKLNINWEWPTVQEEFKETMWQDTRVIFFYN